MPHDVFGAAGATRDRFALQDLVTQFTHRDTEAETVLRWKQLFCEAWEELPEVDRGIIGRQITRAGRAFGMPEMAGLYLLPSVMAEEARAYVSAGGVAIVFDSFTFEALNERACKHLIRHELAHVWQAATGMTRGPLTPESLEALADWQADYQLLAPVWRPIETFRAE